MCKAAHSRPSAHTHGHTLTLNPFKPGPILFWLALFQRARPFAEPRTRLGSCGCDAAHRVGFCRLTKSEDGVRFQDKRANFNLKQLLKLKYPYLKDESEAPCHECQLFFFSFFFFNYYYFLIFYFIRPYAVCRVLPLPSTYS